MTVPPASGQAERFEARVSANDHFAWVRTRLAVERTMMAYMRTSTSLIAFGFTIFQFIDRIQQARVDDVRFPYAAWYLGLALILCGVAAAMFSLVDYRRQINYLRSGTFGALAGELREPSLNSLYMIAGVLVVIGIFAFGAVLTSVK